MDDMLNDNMFYQTGNLALAVAVSLYYPLEAVDRDDPYEVQFVFRHSPQFDELVEQFYGGELLVEPQAYVNQLRLLQPEVCDIA